MVIRLISVSDQMELDEFHEVFQTVLGWSGDVGYIFRIHGKDYNGFGRRRCGQALQEFHLQSHEKFLYTCDVLDLWEWDIRVLDIQDGESGDDSPVCLGGRGATPPEFCGGPRGYRLMLKRHEEGSILADPDSAEAGIELLIANHPEQPNAIWDTLRGALKDGLKSIDRRLAESGPLQPHRFRLKEVNERLAQFVERRRVWGSVANFGLFSLSAL